MRTLKLSLVLSVIAALGVAAMPMTASGAISDFEKKQNAKIKKANKKVNNAIDDIAALDNDLSSSNTAQNNKNASQDETIGGLQDTVNTIVAGVPDIVNGLTALQAGLTAIQGALQDPVTGLVGLNNARTQFAAFGDGGGFLGGTSSGGGLGPDSQATQLGNGAYIVDFNNDVSQRFLTINVFPDAGGGMWTGQAVSCVRASTSCGSDASDRVLVTIQGQPGGPGTAVVPANPDSGAWSIAAISG